MKNILPKQYAEIINSFPQAAKVIIFLLLFGIIFTLWRVTLWSPLQNKKLDTQKKSMFLTHEIQLLQKNIALLQDTLAKQKPLPTPQTSKQPVTASASITAPSPQNISKTLKALLNTNKLTFISIDATPTSIAIDKTTQLKTFEHKTIIHFNGSYFATISYLEDLEKLNWPIYWDNLIYTVSQYPIANVTLEIHTTSLQEDTNDGKINGNSNRPANAVGNK